MRRVKNLRLGNNCLCLKFIFVLIFGLSLLSTNYTYSQDTDGDGIADSIDIDDDNDGILDVNESVTTIITNNFTSLGAQNFTVPEGITQITIDLWGAGGGNSDGGGTAAAGGGGGYGGFTLDVTPGDIINIFVGQGGTTDDSFAQIGGGGAGGPTIDSFGGSSGGGYTSVSLNGTMIAVIGGGGGSGGGPAHITSFAGPGGNGTLVTTGGNIFRAGGDSANTSTSSPNNNDGGGKGGQLTLGGARGDSSLFPNSNNSSPSEVLGTSGSNPTGTGGVSGGTGGNSPFFANTGGGGGGGGGYSGGGGGVGQNTNTSMQPQERAGGGGSSFILTSLSSVSSGVLIGGSGQFPGNSGNSNYISGKGQAGIPAGDGLVVIQYTSLADADGDGVVNSLDIDSDGDGILDSIESQTTASTITPSGMDSDNDGLDDAFDATPNTGPTGSNGTTPVNTDGTFGPDYLDIDADDDGIPDNVEAQSTLGYLTPTGTVGTNGLDSAYENNDTYSATSFTLVNTDGDAEPDFRDTDSDGDGTTDINENGEGNILSGSDLDDDGLDNNFDQDNTTYDVNDNINTPSTDLPDSDSDVNSGSGDVDYRDNFIGPDIDTDGDGINNSVDIDDDGDGILDTVECGSMGSSPSIPFTSLGQARNVTSAGVYFFNLNGDTFSTYVDANGYVQVAIDFGNGFGALPQGTSLTNSTRGILTPAVLAELTDAVATRISYSAGNFDVTTNNTNILSRIRSNTAIHQGAVDNGINNGWTGTGATALIADASCNSSLGFALHQNIVHICGNGNGMHWNPNISQQKITFNAGEIPNTESLTLWVRANTVAIMTTCADSDGDGITNDLDLDADGDGIPDNIEAQTTAGFTAPTGTDTDNDGLDDAYDATPTTGATGSNGTTPVNTDGTSGADYTDIDSDDDGIPDNVEAQSTLGYVTPTGNVGVNGLDAAYENTDTFNPTVLVLINTDADAEPDFRDTDSDDDGTTDINENGDVDNTTSGTDTDGDGLDDNFDENNVTYDVNDNINTPATDLPDADADVNSGGDVDYRDSANGLDTDGDGVPDTVDIDDDGDGILDINEGFSCTTFDGSLWANDEDRDLIQISNINGTPTQANIATLSTSNTVGDIGFAPDGQLYAVTFNSANLFLVNQSTGALTSVATIASSAIQFNSLSFGEDGMAYVGANDSAEIYRINPATGTSTIWHTFPSGVAAGDFIFINGFVYVAWLPVIGTTDVHLYRVTIDSNNDFVSFIDMGSLPASSFGLASDGVNTIYVGDGNGSIYSFETPSTPVTTIAVTFEYDLSGGDDIFGLTSTAEATGNGCFTTDTDNDGIPNHLDLDSDNDGITDNLEAQTTASFAVPTGTDTDGDGLDDAYDATPSGGSTGSNGVTPTNSDTDAAPDYLDIDADDDGIPDNVEAQSTQGYTAPNGVPGNNGLDSAYDFTDLYTSTGLSTSLVNTDGDAEPDFRDTDSDADGTNDVLENGNANAPIGTDTDGDGLDDAFEGASTNDVDVNDEINTPSTDLPDGDGDVNTINGDVDYRDDIAGIDTDNDGIPDSVDIDDDNDGILDTVEGSSACVGGTVGSPFTSLGQARSVTSAGVYFFDLNGDTFSTYVDANGYVQVAIDFGNGDDDLPQTTALTNSTRGILNPTVLAELTDANEARISHSGGNLDVTTTNATILSRITTNTALNRGLTDNAINDSWVGTEASALTIDSTCDFSGATSLQNVIIFVCNDSGMRWLPVIDFQRIRNASGDFPGEIANTESFTLWVRGNFDSTCLVDDDNDGIPNSLDQDSDGDGILDIIESQASTGAIALSGVDSDMDGLDDAFDATPTTGANESNGTTPINTDTDTNPDYLDIDADNDGIPDNVEAQSTQGYTAPSGTVGFNGVDTAYENNDTFTATGLTPVNFDGTDEPDYRDTDTDNDGVTDSNEGLTNINLGTLGTDSDGDGLDDIYEGSDATAGEAFDVNDEVNNPVTDLTDSDLDAGTTGDADYRDISFDLDTDSDGIPDNVDIDDDNDGILDTVEDAIPDSSDDDNDGIPNSRDIDSDNDGIPDNVEAQSTLGYIAPSGSGTGITDVDMDGLDDVYDPDCTPCATNGTAITPVNTDNITGNNTDTTPDYLDADSDGDGINDILENGNADTVSGIDTDGDGLDDAFEGVITDNDVNDDIDNPLTDLPDIDTDASTAGSNTPAVDYNDVDYRDIDDDRMPITAGKILWVRSDRDTSNSGSTLTGWTDQTNTGIVNTINGDPTITQFINFNPTVTLDGAGDNISTNLNINSNIYPDISIFAVYTPAFNNAGGVWGEDNGGFDRFILDAASLNDAVSSGTTAASNIPNIFSIGSTVATTVTFDEDNAAFVYANGLQSANFTPNHGPETSNLFQIGALGSNNFNFSGSISEIIVYGSVLSALERQSVESYLAIKSGITLDATNNDGTIVEGDYLLNDQTTKIWNYTTCAAYHNDVAGIVRDDDMLLYQKQSSSINSDGIITMGLGSIVANNDSNTNSINANKSALMWGNNNASLTAVTSSALLCETENQMDRVWKVVETGTVGTVEVAAVKTTVDAALNELSVIFLKVADDAAFTTNVRSIPVTTRDVNGVMSYVANVDFNGTKYFTYSDILGIFWNGDANAWTGGAGTAGAPAVDAIGSAIDGTKVLVINSGAAQRNAVMTASANVECVWVQSNSKLVINNDLFLEFDQDFLLEGEIRLIGDAQLIQSHSGPSNVQGNGTIYRDQQARVPNTYRYHYWSTPVVAALGNTTYTVESVMKDGTVPTSENSTPKEINFVDYTGALSTLNGLPTDPITIASFWINSYFNGVDRDDWVQQIHTGNINIGEGFIMKSTGRVPQNFTFMGSPNDGVITAVLTPGTSSLLGNPYPSVINADQFIIDNQDVIDGTLYFWEHLGESTTTDVQTEGHGEFGYVGGYSQRNRAMGVAANSVINGTAGLGQEIYRSPPQFISVGQGFFVTTPANKGGILQFRNSQRGFNASNVFFRNSSDSDNDQELPNFKLGMDYVNDTNAEIHRQLGANFKVGNTFDYENGYDSKTIDIQPTDIFWDFDQIESNLIIAGLGEITTELQIPLGFYINSDFPVTVMLDEKENMEGYTIYLGDLVTGRLYNLENPVELNLPKGNYTNRFVILFGGTSLSTDDNPLLQGLNVFRNNTTDEIIIRNNNSATLKKVEVFNVLGQQVKSWKTFTNTTEERFYFNPSSAIYIVKVTTGKGEITKKIVVD